jgi:5-(carboxyamino)imidazole ribonucleotide mutase
MTKRSPQKKVAVIMGSSSDLKVMKAATIALGEFKIPFHIEIVSAHRTPKLMMEFAKGASDRGFGVIIAGAGGAAHLPGMVAAFTSLPVIGVPVLIGKLDGLDALLSVAQMPKGVPVATVAVDNAYNAGILAAQILAVGNETLTKRLDLFKRKLAQKVKTMNSDLKKKSSLKRRSR